MIIPHHIKSGYKRFSSSGDFVQTNSGQTHGCHSDFNMLRCGRGTIIFYDEHSLMKCLLSLMTHNTLLWWGKTEVYGILCAARNQFNAQLLHWFESWKSSIVWVKHALHLHKLQPEKSVNTMPSKKWTSWPKNQFQPPAFLSDNSASSYSQAKLWWKRQLLTLNNLSTNWTCTCSLLVSLLALEMNLKKQQQH